MDAVDSINAQLDQLESTRPYTENKAVVAPATSLAPTRKLFTFVNGEEIHTEAQPEETLLEFLRGAKTPSIHPP